MNSAALAILLAAGLCAPTLAQGEKPAEKKPAAPAPAAAQPGKPGDMKQPSPEELKKMKEEGDAWQKAGIAGAEHEFLKKAAGTWSGKVTSYEDASKPPVKSTCSETVTSILGGKFTKCEIKGDLGSMSGFEGLGLYGYDNAKQKYTMAWADSMGTCIMDGTGELSADKKTMTWTMNLTNPLTHKTETMREVEHFISDTETHMEMWGTMVPGQPEVKMLEIDFTRAAATEKKPATK
jgi:hypothetical protein